MAKKTKAKAKAGASKAEAAQKRALFIKAMVANGGNATQAAITAGYSAKTAKQAGSRLLTHVDVKAAIAKTRGAALTAADLTVERVLREVARLAFLDPGKLYDGKGNLLDVPMLDDDTRAAVASVEVTEEFDGHGEDRASIGFTKKVKLCDKNAALEKAMKHLGQYAKDNGQVGKAIGRAIIVPAKHAA